MTTVSSELRTFFAQLHINRPSLPAFRRNQRHLADFKRFEQELDAIKQGRLVPSRLFIGALFLNRRTYILHHGPWRGYFRKRHDGTWLALRFVDLRP